jgi:hypothetical protein
VLDVREEHPVLSFADIGALVYQLRAVSWQVPDFDPERYRDALNAIHAHISAHGRFDVHAHRFLLTARPQA